MTSILLKMGRQAPFYDRSQPRLVPYSERLHQRSCSILGKKGVFQFYFPCKFRGFKGEGRLSQHVILRIQATPSSLAPWRGEVRRYNNLLWKFQGFLCFQAHIWSAMAENMHPASRVEFVADVWWEHTVEHQGHPTQFFKFRTTNFMCVKT